MRAPPCVRPLSARPFGTPALPRQFMTFEKMPILLGFLSLYCNLRWVGGIMYKNSEIEETGVAAGVLGHPALGVAWLANKLGSHGVALEPGHLVLAGSFTRVVFAEKGDTLHADFGALGGIAVQFV